MQAPTRSSNGRPALQIVTPRAALADGASGPPPVAEAAAIPNHIAIIMDGNGRWASQRGLSRQAGHRAGTENIRRVIKRLGEHGVRHLTIYAFSTENWGRPRREVAGLLRLPGRFLRRELKHLHENGIRLHHIGHLEVLDVGLQRQVQEAIELTRENTGMTLSIAFNYGGRRELVDAMRRIVTKGIPPDEIDEATIAAHLDTAGLPDPDLIIRTAGEMRLSNFLLWQAAYAEYYTTPTYWPDFGPEELDAALAAYAARTRRFGVLPVAEHGER